jgi:hypothetical protein
MGVSNIVLGSNNLTPTGNALDVTSTLAPYNKLYLNLGGQSLAGKKIGLNKININYSWPNINFFNNTFSFSWPTGAATYTDVSVTIPVYSNYSDISSLNSYLNTVLIANGMYVTNTTTNTNLYFMQFIENPSLYGISLVLNLVPTSTPASYTTPAGFAGWPTVSRTMKFTTNTSNFNLLIGFAKSTVYNGNTSSVVYNSQYVPIFSPVSSVNVTCNLANNELALNNDSTIIFTGTSIGTEYGSMIQWEPNNIVYYDVTSTSNNLIVSFTDQNNTPLYIMDPAISVFFTVIN